jgi:CheY-like chemotaxis protein
MMLVRAIRAQTNFSRFPIILTSSSELREGGHSFEDMVHATLMKPTAPEEMLRALSGALWRADWRSFYAEDAPGEAAASGQSTREKRVLVAEDNAVNLAVIRRLLEKAGYEVQVAKDGEEAFEVARQADFDFIFMDCHMPRMDGYQATRAIRDYQARENARLVPIIAVTADAMPETREACLAAGMNDFVVKPISPRTLLGVLRRWEVGAE